MTSNVGAKLISGGAKSLGFTEEKGETPSYERIRELVMNELKNVFRPEFLNRVDDIIVPLAREEGYKRDSPQNVGGSQIKSCSA